MHSAAIFAGAAGLLAGVAQAQYSLTSTFDDTNFFDTFDFFTGTDPTAGFVDYLDSGDAMSQGLAGYQNGQVYMGVDASTTNPSAGRASVRVTSQQAWTHGLFIADIAHMPGSICGAWPAYWLVGPNWPASGEIDIIEGVNTQTTVQSTLHTSPGCIMADDGVTTGTILAADDCGADSGYTGCGETTTNNQNYGDGFNDIEGGVYATEWTSDYISIWFFPRSSIPADITAETPDPSGWGAPQSTFSGSGCDIDTYFQNNQIVFDTTFCGQWAGQVWSANSECAALSDSCNDYVGANPSAFSEAYWLVNSIKVYTE